MSQKIKVLIYGTGFAGQGHAEAFRYATAEVVGIVGRTESAVQQVAKDLNIPYAGTDWQQALIDCQPDVVSIGTPGGAHVEPIKQAIEFGCHVFCDKPRVDPESNVGTICVCVVLTVDTCHWRLIEEKCQA